MDTQSIIEKDEYKKDLEYIQLTTKNLYDTLISKSSSDFTDQTSIDSLKAITKQVYDIDIKLKEMEKYSLYMCKSQDTSNADVCIMK